MNRGEEGHDSTHNNGFYKKSSVVALSLALMAKMPGSYTQ